MTQEEAMTLFESDPTPRAVTRRSDGMILYANEAYAEMRGETSVEAVIGKTTTGYWVDPKDREAFIALLEERGKLARHEVRLRRADGSEFWASAHAALVEYQGEACVVATYADITAEWRMREDQDRLVAEKTQDLAAELVERRQAEAEWQNSEKRFQDLLDVLSDWYWETDRGHRFTLLKGRSPYGRHEVSQSAIGKTRWEANYDSEQDAAAWQAHQADLDAQRPFRDFRYTVPSQNGGRDHIRVDGAPAFDEAGEFIGYRGLASDISAEVHAREAALRAEESLRGVIANLPVGFAYFDEEERLTYSNDLFAEIFIAGDPLSAKGMTFEELVHQRVTHGSIADAIGKEDDWIAWRLLEHRQGSSENLIRLADGRHYMVMDKALSGGGSAVIYVDITERERAEEARLALVAEKEREGHARRLAEEANVAKSAFLANMSHELLTPLNAVLGFAQLLRDYSDQPLTAEQTEHLDQVLRGGGHLLALVDEVLDLSRIETGQLDVTPESLQPAALVEACIALVKPQAEARGITVSEACDTAQSFQVMADPMRLRQVLINLLSNAVKYNRDHGAVIVTVTPKGDDMVRFSVADTGIGIPVAEQESIFQPFSRIHQEDRTVDGTGIGLAIAKELAGLMGGRLEMESDAGIGSTFWLDLPKGGA
jgi:PAS domain S-box-containing protein